MSSKNLFDLTDRVAVVTGGNGGIASLGSSRLVAVSSGFPEFLKAGADVMAESF